MLREGGELTLIGVLIGIVLAVGLTRLMRTLLYGVNPADALTFVSVGILLMGVAIVACYVPARRASDVDPMAALRHE